MLTWLNSVNIVLGVGYSGDGIWRGSSGLEASRFLDLRREPVGKRRGLAAMDDDGPPQRPDGLPGPAVRHDSRSQLGGLPWGASRLELDALG